MSRRRTIVLSSAAVLLGVAVLLLGIGGVATRTEFGQERVRAFLNAWLASKVRGTMYVGRVHGSLFDGVTVDSIEIRDDLGELFLASGPSTVVYDLRDVFDRRVVIRSLTLTNPVVNVRKYADGTWNFRRIFPRGQPAPIGRRRGFSEFVVIDSATITGGAVSLQLPWTGPERASASVRAAELAAAIAGGRVRETRHGPVRSWTWNAIRARLGHTRLAHPDTAGRASSVRELAFVSRTPPFDFHGVRGAVRQLGDTVSFVAHEWKLPGSSGSARGTVSWGGGRPTRYSAYVDAPRASLADLAWIHETFPRAGGGRMRAHIRNTTYDPSLVEYAVTDMDVRSHRSRLVGSMIVDPNGRVLAVRDVDLRLDPVNFELLRTLKGSPFTYDWSGEIRGTVRASGGPVNRFRVERADLVFNDAHVPGAVSAGTASGVIDIFEPAYATFHGMRVNVARFDLRTPRAVIRDFPQLGGTVSGTATLDSLWMDVRFRDADLVHRDGDAPPSRFTGAGRVTSGRYMTYDVNLIAQPVSFASLARSYPALPLRGEMSGPISVRGQAPRLVVSTRLTGAAGELSYEGIVDADEPSYGADGTGAFARLDLSRLAGARTETRLDGRYLVALSGADRATAAGRFDVALDDSRVGDVPVERLIARGSLERGLVSFDTLLARTPAGEAEARGTIAIVRDRAGALRATANVDSLNALTQVARALAKDSTLALDGRARFAGELRTGPEVRAVGEVTAERVVVGPRRAARVAAAFDAPFTRGPPSGSVRVTADTLRLRSATISRLDADVSVPRTGTGSFRAMVSRDDRASLATAGAVWREGDASTWRADSVVVRIDTNRVYRSAAPSTLRLARGIASLDSLVLRAADASGSLAARDIVWAPDSIRGTLRTHDADLALLRGAVPGLTRAAGPLRVSLDLSGTPDRPFARGTIQITDGSAALAGTGARYENIDADIALDATTVTIRELSAETPRGGARRGRARVTGSVDLANYTVPVFSLEATAREFRVLDRAGVATLDVSTQPALRLNGPYTGAVLRGSLVVDEGTIYLPDRIDKDIADLGDPELLALVDTAAAERRLLPAVPSAFATNLRVDDVSVVIGEDVWLRSAEANIELGGSLRVTRTPRDEDAQLALVGTLNALRGTYVLNLAVVQPTFEVERGTLRFFGTGDLNPTLDIRAIHTVRQPRTTIARADVRILVAITGTLRNPELTLSSADNLPLSQSDLLSYLVTGEPSFALTGSSTQYAEQILTIGGRLAGNIISAHVPRSLFDIVEVRTGAVRLDAGSGGVTGSYLNTLYNTRVILGKQIGERWFVGLSTGLCRANFTENLGLRLEYRFSNTLFAQGGIEPGSGDLSCVGPSTARTFHQTPQQLGVDVFRSWRF